MDETAEKQREKEEAEEMDAMGNIITYWFGTEYWHKAEPRNPTSYYDDLWRQRWFAKEELTAVVDQYIQTQFGKFVEKALQGHLDSWATTSHGALALIVLLDQFTRNIYRNTPRAWDGDAKALAVCLSTMEKGLHLELKLVGRAVFYMPLLHAESAELQEKSMEAFNGLWEEAKTKSLGSAAILERFHKIAIRHRDVIALFGRFPERNKYLNRHSTTQEAAYLSG